jgi:signal transduction histidine kinase
VARCRCSVVPEEGGQEEMDTVTARTPGVAPARGTLEMTPVQRRLWVAAWLVGLAAVAVGDLGFIINGTEPEETVPLDISIGLTSVVAGLLVWSRHPRNRIGPLLYLLGVVWALGGLWSLADASAFQSPSWARQIFAEFAPVIGVASTALMIHVVMAYPSGRLDSRVARATVALGYLTYVVQATAALSHRAPPEPLSSALFLILAIVAVGTLSRRWYRAGPVARRVYAPVLAAGWLVAATGLLMESLVLTTDDSPRWVFLSFTVSRLLLPIGFLIGMMRSRLDRGEVGELVIGLDHMQPSRSLRDVLAKTLHDPSLEVAYWMPERNGFVDEFGVRVDVPVESPTRAVTMVGSEGERLAAIVHDPALRDDFRLVDAVASTARMAIERERLTAQVRAQLEEVRASRARIIEATDAERRRVERDLHDGAQQRLVSLAMRLQLAKESSVGASVLLDEATAELQVAIGEVRALARGLHPTILTEAGLGAAMEALAERAPLPVTLGAPDARYPAPIEAAAYFVVAEALANLARYAVATEARVDIVEDRHRLVVTVADDGGGGADPARGSGLRGLSDRVAAIGGKLTVTSPPGHGTIVRAELPLA